jgi:mRNA-degrading endonuclease toxin of MazEF toxin-antitoxin module
VRPGLVVSVDQINQGRHRLVIVVPCTKQHHGIPSHIPMTFWLHGSKQTGYICCEHVRSISTVRLKGRMAATPAPPQVMALVEDCLRDLLAL